MPHPQPVDGSISDLSRKAATNLSALCEDNHRKTAGRNDQTATYTYINEIQRLDIWIGDHGVDHGRLDYKLREASPLRDRVFSLLTELKDLSNSPRSSLDIPKVQAQNVGRVDRYPGTPQVEIIPNSSSQERNDRSISETSSSSIDTNISFPDSLPDLPLIRAHDIITLLLELGPSLLDPAPHDRLEGLAHPDAARFDLDHVRSKYPQADENLIRRLGMANWERRQYLRKLRLVHEENGDHMNTLKTSEKTADLNDLSETDAASTAQSSDSDACLSGDVSSRNLGAGYADSEALSEQSERHDTSATASTRSHLDFWSTNTKSTVRTEVTHELGLKVNILGDAALTRYTMPPPPNAGGKYTGETFHCPYCFHLLSDIKSPKEWRKHVFEDLKPYMCTYTNCLMAGKTYPSKQAWWQHEIDRHRLIRQWSCAPCEQGNRRSLFNTPASFDEHVVKHHPVNFTDIQLQSIRDICQRSAGVKEPHDQCPLCQETIRTKSTAGSKERERSVRKHVSTHLEQLAFFVAFPAGQMISKDDDSEFQDDSDSETGVRTEIESIVSRNTHLSKKNVQIANVQRFIADQERTEDTWIEAAVPTKSKSDHEKSTTSLETGHRSVPFEANPPSPKFPIRLLMHPPNEHFYSRESLLADADKILSSPGSICIFHGVGGVGKTLAAIQYIYTHQERFDAVFWLQADTAPGLSDSYLQMAVSLGLFNGAEDHHQVLEKGRTWLQETDKNWLLVFDNVLHWADISRYLPNTLMVAKGSVLITTQAENLIEKSQNTTKMRLDPLNQQAGSEMLLRYLGRDVKTDPEKKSAGEISAFVGGIPVAIAQVAGYVEYSEITLEELIETFRQWRKRTGMATDEADDLPVSFREDSFSYDGTLAMVWEVTLRELGEDARDLLNILAHLNCEAVPKKMLFGMHEDPSLQFLDAREKIRLRRIERSLIRRRLVQAKEVDGDSCLSIHRSLQRGIREKLSRDKNKQQTVFDQAVALVREVFPRSNPLQQPMPEKWSECQRLLPHLHALHDVYHKFNPHIKGSIDFAQLLSDAGMDQFERGITQEGLLLLKTAEEALDACSPEDHQVMRADINAMIAIMYDNTGIEKREEAFTRRKIALDIRKEIFENAVKPRQQDEILLYNSWMEYAISLLHYHRYRQAEPIIESCLRKFQEWGPEDEIPFEYAKYYNKIALVRMYQGRFDEAIQLAQRGVRLMKKTGYTLFESRFKFDLACIILQSEDLNRALNVHHEILDQRLEKLGQTNELTLHSTYAIGAIHELQGDFDQAEIWFRKALDQRRSLHSWPDEAFSRAQFHLARVLLARGHDEDIEVANYLHGKALRVLHRLLPLDPPPELKDVTDEAILFDHMLPISPGGARFTGRGLLPYFMHGD